MTELARIETPEHLPARHEPGGLPALGAGLAALQQWAEVTQAAAQLIAQIVDTPFFPASLMPKLTGGSDEDRAKQRAGAIANGTGAVMTGAEIGLSPMQALSNVIVIHGRPSLYANTMVALVQAAGHEIWTEESTETRAVVCGRRAGSDKVERGEMTIERARKAGWVAKNTNYVSNPVAMLYARAAAIACNRTAPEVLKGIAAFEALQDDQQVQRPAAPPVPRVPVSVAEITGGPTEPAAAEPEPSESAQPAAERSLTERATALVDWFAGKWGVPADVLAARVGRPVQDWSEADLTELRDVGAALGRGETTVPEQFPPADSGPDEPVDGELIDDDPAADDSPPAEVPANLMRRLFAMLADLGVKGDDKPGRLRVAESVLNREITSFSELTADDAHAVVDALVIYQEAGEGGRETVAILAAPDQEAGK